MKITKELLMEIIEVFEDFLDEKGIEIQNPEKDEDPDGAANIYGTDYGNLEETVAEVLLQNGAEEGRFE